jgi:hypothetical protein
MHALCTFSGSNEAADSAPHASYGLMKLMSYNRAITRASYSGEGVKPFIQNANRCTFVNICAGPLVSTALLVSTNSNLHRTVAG